MGLVKCDVIVSVFGWSGAKRWLDEVSFGGCLLCTFEDLNLGLLVLRLPFEVGFFHRWSSLYIEKYL